MGKFLVWYKLWHWIISRKSEYALVIEQLPTKKSSYSEHGFTGKLCKMCVVELIAVLHCLHPKKEK